MNRKALFLAAILGACSFGAMTVYQKRFATGTDLLAAGYLIFG